MRGLFIGGSIGIAILALLGVPLRELILVTAWYAGIVVFGWTLYRLGERWKAQQPPRALTDDSTYPYFISVDPGRDEVSVSESYIALSPLQRQLEQDGVVDLPSLGIRITKLDSS